MLIYGMVSNSPVVHNSYVDDHQEQNLIRQSSVGDTMLHPAFDAADNSVNSIFFVCQEQQLSHLKFKFKLLAC